MARIRSLKPSFFLNEDLANLSPLHRLLFQGLWVLADRQGRLTDKPKTIKAQVLPHDECDVNAMLDDLSAGPDPFIARYAVEGKSYIHVVNFAKHQNPHHKEPDSAIPSISLAKTQSPVITRQDSGESRNFPSEPCGSLVLGSCSLVLDSGSGSGSDASPAQSAVDDIKPPRPRPKAANGIAYTSAESDAWAKETGVTLLPPKPIRPARNSIDQSFRHRACIGGGSWASCARGACVPPNLAANWIAQGFDEEYCAKLVGDYLDPIPTATALETDGYKLWRSVWSAIHRPDVPDTRPRKGDGMIRDVAALMAKYEAEAQS